MGRGAWGMGVGRGGRVGGGGASSRGAAATARRARRAALSSSGRHGRHGVAHLEHVVPLAPRPSHQRRHLSRLPRHQQPLLGARPHLRRAAAAHNPSAIGPLRVHLPQPPHARVHAADLHHRWLASRPYLAQPALDRLPCPRAHHLEEVPVLVVVMRRRRPSSVVRIGRHPFIRWYACLVITMVHIYKRHARM